MKLKLIKHLRLRIAVGIEEVDTLKIDSATAHLQIRRTRLVCHQTRFIENGSHATRIAKCTIKALEAVIDEIELVGNGVGIGEHNNQCARSDAVPRIASSNKHGYHRHYHHRDAGSNNATSKRCPHTFRIARHHFPVRVIKQPTLIVFAAIRFYRQNIRHRVRQLARKLVLRTSGFFVQGKNALI